MIPAPEIADYPVILPGSATPRLRVYPHYTVVAEKLEALTSLGIANSRMKDYFDLWMLAQHFRFDGEILRQAVRATFDRRQTVVPDHPPFGLTQAFARDRLKQAQWSGFFKKNRLDDLSLDEVVAGLADFLVPVILAAHANQEFRSWWTMGGPWAAGDPG